jgi:cyclase
MASAAILTWPCARMSPSDTIVYVPSARVAWTGNLIFGEGTIPWAQSGGVATYRATLRRLSETLDIGAIVPGHGALTTGDTIGVYIRYLEDVERVAGAAVRDGTSLDLLVASARIPVQFHIRARSSR